ncbi:unnamed protein product, partial [Heterotrigona itama]
NPYILKDPDNFKIANPIVTPTHIKPERHFLFAYSILRSIPNKLGENSYILRDPDNFKIANPIVTPTHIKPERHFLFAYSILRSIPNKLGESCQLTKVSLKVSSMARLCDLARYLVGRNNRKRKLEFLQTRGLFQ